MQVHEHRQDGDQHVQHLALVVPMADHLGSQIHAGDELMNQMKSGALARPGDQILKVGRDLRMVELAQDSHLALDHLPRLERAGATRRQPYTLDHTERRSGQRSPPARADTQGCHRD